MFCSITTERIERKKKTQKYVLEFVSQMEIDIIMDIGSSTSSCLPLFVD